MKIIALKENWWVEENTLSQNLPHLIWHREDLKDPTCSVEISYEVRMLTEGSPWHTMPTKCSIAEGGRIESPDWEEIQVTDTHWRVAHKEKLYSFALAQRSLLPWAVGEQEQADLKGLVRSDHGEQEGVECLARILCFLGGKKWEDEVKVSESHSFPKTALTLKRPKETRNDLNYLKLKLKDRDIIFLPTEAVTIILNLYITLSEIFGPSNQQVIFAKCMWFRFLKSWFQFLGIFVIPSSPPNLLHSEIISSKKPLSTQSTSLSRLLYSCPEHVPQYLLCLSLLL